MANSFRQMNPQDILHYLKQRKETENTTWTEVIMALAEVQRRKLFFVWGHTSLYEFTIKTLAYNEMAAHRRVQAAFVYLSNPEIKEDLQNGSIHLTHLSKMQTVIKKEERRTGKKVSIAEKRDLIAKLRNTTSRETDFILAEKFDESFYASENRVIERPKANGEIELTLRLPKELFQDLQRIKELYSHISPGADWIEVIELMIKDIKRARDPLSKKLDAKKLKTQSPQNFLGKQNENPPQNNIPRAIQVLIHQRDQGKCQFKHPNGEICGSRFQIQIDHIEPKFAGGTNELSNLRLLCAAHNRERYRSGN